MSQVKTLPITATRWLSLLLCAITAATITVFLSKVGLVQNAYSSWGAILNANPILHYSSAFLAGIGIKLLLDRFYISHAKRSIGFNWRYPPVTITVLASYFLTAFYMLSTAPKFDEAALYAQSFMSLKYLALTFIGMIITVIYQTKLYTQKPIFTAVLVALSLIYIVFAVSLADITPAFNVFMYLAASYLILAIYLLIDEHRQSKQQGFMTEDEPSEAKEIPELKTLTHFREWFKDDSIIKSTEELEPDLQVYAKRISKRLQNGGNKDEKDLAQHIALCGPYGCGKSSIVESIVNDLAKNSQKESTWIQSDISTWGAASGSVAHVILSNIIDDISQHIDMCAFRTLPKHYTEALKSGGSVFQFASTLLAGPVDIEGSFQKLNDVLYATNHKLLITLQDVDRGTGDENEKRLNDIAALLDRLKNRDLSHINFIVAMGNENEVAAEVISKATDYREDILRADLSAVINSFIQVSLKEALHHNKVIILSNNMPKVVLNPNRIEDSHSVHVFCKRSEFIEALIKRNNVFIKEVNALKAVIVSIRQLKKILRRVDQAWVPGNLMGEVNFLSFLMACSLREVKPTYFSAFENSYDYLVKVGSGNVTPIIKDVMKIEEPIYFKFFATMLGLITRDYKESTNDKEALSQDASNFEDGDELNKFHLSFNKALLPTQSLGVSDPNANYLQKIIKESPSKKEINEQTIFSRIRDGNELEALAKELCCDERYQLVLLRFKDILFKRSSSFTDRSLNKVLFDYVSTEVKKNKYQNAENFKELFTRLVIKILNIDNFQSVIKDVATINDIFLLSAIFIEIKREAESNNSSEFIEVLEKQDFSSIALDLLEYEVTYEMLCIISQIENGAAGEPGKRYFRGPKYEFILDLLKDKKDEKSLKILIEVLSTDLNVDMSNIFTAVSSLDKETKLIFIDRLKGLINTGFDEDKRDKAINILSSKL
ncbi:P-loop NTPase fold protein [Pseudoalteromonas carrageenovora]|uniref:P-loop NTPase fold protein n=1 Tax=Pseudoalteromonas carrageenovora TaxID=227 RepID=UPI0026E3FE49|nr:P-loop NTPase fold protein [Pseudoalteromonas carrageenovora]MDO6836848.1 P-loop NTPase fold protein [Pseudoalteromonas carrageenovora]